MALVQRLLEVAIKLAAKPDNIQPSKFSESGTDTVTLSGFRTSVRIQNSGAPAGNTAHVDVYGMTPSLMNQLSTLGLAWNFVPHNTMVISAGDSSIGLSKVFTGTILAGYANYDSAPDVPFHFEAQSVLADAVSPVPVSSYTGATSIVTIMEEFAKKMGLGFENNGVDVQLRSPYFWGNTLTQLRTAADAANINAEIVDGGTTLAIWPKSGNRSTPSVPFLSKETGMIGYPAWTNQGIIVRTVFNPNIKFGGLFKVQTSLPKVNKVATWAVNTLDLALDSLVPRGQWMMTINAWNPQGQKPLVKL